MNSTNIKLNSPSLMLLTGVSGSGKSFLTAQIIRARNEIYTQPVEKVLFCYKAYQSIYESLERELGEEIVFYQGLPSLDYITKFTANSATQSGRQTLLIFDDLQGVSVDSKLMSEIAQVYSHHRNASVILLMQNLYSQGRFSRDISLNAHYIVVFRNIRDKAQLAYLSRQIFPGNGALIPQILDDIAKRHRYPYVLIDLSPYTQNEDYRIRTKILPGEISEIYLTHSL